MSILTVTGIQTNLFWEDREANLRQFEAKINSIQEKTQLVVLPEMFSTGFSMEAGKLAETMQGPTLNWMKRIAAAKKIILAGSLIIAEAGNYYNRLVWMMPNGQFGYYDKRHLFAYGGEDRPYTRGQKRLIGSVNGWKVNCLVCYDLRFPVWCRQAPARPGEDRRSPDLEYDLMIVVANWPHKRQQAWRALLIARAMENQCYVLGINRIGQDGHQLEYRGDSLLIDPLGNILQDCGDKETVFTASLDKLSLIAVREKFPFWKDADDFHIEANRP